ncbi:GGDEF domain-containing protein [Pelovirga terrestris]|uniref:diguanylate cyclase n=1 Tax=Pelovirga terrestris TaxID=2771352 RepID=A0A8J6UHR1_9BACT|nr:GGDEF domain-containing protein [Pelovirga terrestris]MBD1401833.1 GGDEF domain-containing protein [Pelovirga terrestris]
MTPLFEWTPLLDTGLEESDRQHQHLLNLINAFGDAVAHRRVNEKNVATLYDELVDYTCYHFEEEERLMSQSRIDPRHVTEHTRMHQRFIAEVGRMYQNYLNDQQEGGNHLFEFLLNWVAYHIMGTDMAMARQLQAIAGGTDPQAAYALEGRHSDKRTALLLRSLKNLFEQVSQRNYQLTELNRSLEEKVRHRTHELEKANTHLEMLASTDVLTGLANRRRAMEILRLLWQDATTNQQPLSCMMIDADNFKQVNDRYGHDAGDEVLRVLARELTETVRTDDSVCRLGGDEFMLICPSTDAAGAMYLAQQLHGHINTLKIPAGEGYWQGSISVGVATRTPAMTAIEGLIKAADRSLYAAKAAGRNCVRLIP